MLRFLALSSAATILTLYGCDEVIRPDPPMTIEESLLDLMMSEGLTEFLALSSEAQINDAYDNPAVQLTIFAPTNQAFGALPAGTSSCGRR